MKMNEGQMLEYAGDLSVEMEEIRKLYTEKKEQEEAASFTYTCQGFLTIICC